MKNLPKHAHPIERLIAHDLVNAIVAADCNISIWDGEEYAIRHSTDVAEILSAMSHTGQDYLQIYDAAMVFPADRETAYEGSIDLVYGNEPEYLIADYAGPLVERIVQGITPQHDLPVSYEVEQ